MRKSQPPEQGIERGGKRPQAKLLTRSAGRVPTWGLQSPNGRVIADSDWTREDARIERNRRHGYRVVRFYVQLFEED